MKTKLILISALAFFFSTLSFADDIGMELLPKGERPFRLTFADPREIRMGLNFEGDARIDAAVGNYFSIFAIRPVNEDSWRFHFGLEGAGFFTMRQADHRFPLETADGLIGTYFEGSQGPWQTQLRYTHVSAHLADGSIATPIAYSRETVFLRFAYAPSENWEVYAGPHYIVNTVPILPAWGAQWGGSIFFPLGKTKLVPFTGMDFQWKQETAYNPCYSLQIGVALNNPPNPYHSFRFFYSYYTGQDPRGQFYNHSYTAQSIGLEMQI